MSLARHWTHGAEKLMAHGWPVLLMKTPEFVRVQPRQRPCWQKQASREPAPGALVALGAHGSTARSPVQKLPGGHLLQAAVALRE